MSYKGTFIESSTNIRIENNILYADLRREDGTYNSTSIPFNPNIEYHNINGNFKISQGTFIESSVNIRIENNILYADLRKEDGNYNSTSIIFIPNAVYDNINGNFKIRFEELQVYRFDKKIRCGSNNDGGYVFGELDGEYDCYISAGISNEESFSRDFIDKYNMNENNCFGFDGTIDDYPYNYTKKISFIKKNINNFNDNNNTNLSFLTNKYNNIFLKMDIEGGEYPWLLQIDETQLNKFKQIVIEFHGITNNGWGCNYNDKIKCFEKLSKTHYIIHAHGNNFGEIVNNIPDVIELTYINKNYFNYVPELNTQSLPIDNLDYSNNIGSNDIDLNFYPFKN